MFKTERWCHCELFTRWKFLWLELNSRANCNSQIHILEFWNSINVMLEWHTKISFKLHNLNHSSITLNEFQNSNIKSSHTLWITISPRIRFKSQKFSSSEKSATARFALCETCWNLTDILYYYFSAATEIKMWTCEEHGVKVKIPEIFDYF